MRRLAVPAVVSLGLLCVLPGCKKKNQTPAKAALDAGPAVVATPDAGPGKGASLSPAPLPQPATAERCKAVAEDSGSMLRLVAIDRKVPDAKVTEVEKASVAAFIEACTKDRWPSGLVECLARTDPDLFGWKRCFARIPDVAGIAWDARFNAIVVKAGGSDATVAAVPPPAGGVPFESLCETFLAEMTRLDTCAGGSMYVPDLENVLLAGRAATVGGVIPPNLQADVKKLCTEKTAVVRNVEAEVCRGTVK